MLTFGRIKRRQCSRLLRERLKQQVDRCQIDQNSREDADDQKNQNDSQGILHGTVVAEEDRQANACVDQKPREQSSHRKNIGKVKLGENDRRGAVGNQTNQRGKDVADDRTVGKKQGKLFLANAVDHEIQD